MKEDAKAMAKRPAYKCMSATMCTDAEVARRTKVCCQVPETTCAINVQSSPLGILRVVVGTHFVCPYDNIFQRLVCVGVLACQHQLRR